MTEALYLKDCYLQECTATVIAHKDNAVVLDKTIFYPTGGGQPHDTGTLNNGKTYTVTDVTKNDVILHHITGDKPPIGQQVTCQINWERRYKLMRHHTAAHLLSGLIHNETGAVITGNQLGEESRIDFNLETFDKERFMHFADKANKIVTQALPVHIKFMTPTEAKTTSKLMTSDYDKFSEVRIIDMGIDAQPCGGTHISNTKEIGNITITKLKNKGKNNRRLYYTLQ